MNVAIASGRDGGEAKISHVRKFSAHGQTTSGTRKPFNNAGREESSALNPRERNALHKRLLEKEE